jgi:hypothetical protein
MLVAGPPKRLYISPRQYEFTFQEDVSDFSLIQDFSQKISENKELEDISGEHKVET